MSYETLGAVRMKPGRYATTRMLGPRRRLQPTVRSVGVAMRRSVPAERTIAMRRARRQIPTTYTGATLSNYLVNRADTLDGLGFSLKPGKRLRKVARAIKKNVTLKRALIAGAVVAGAVIAGPAMLSAARIALPAAARGAGRFIRGAGGLVSRAEKGVASLLRGGNPQADPNGTIGAPDRIPVDMGPQPTAPPRVQPGGPQSAMEASAMRAAANQANALDELDESDPPPMQTVSQNGDPVEVTATATDNATAATKPTAPAPAIHPAVLGISGLLLWGLANAPRRH